MSFRSIVIESGARLSLKNNQLQIDAAFEHSVPIEDIDCLLIENTQCTLSSALLASLAENGVAAFFCNSKHLPQAILLPYASHSRQLGIINAQLAMSLPLKKQLWQKIIQAKIINQAKCLQLCGLENEAEKLLALSKQVRSGDSENTEATAAAFYFPALFGRGFNRREENNQNACLNYGYAILRGCLARSLAVYGFLPCLGIEHHSTLNQFNLADDLIEPFRPLVDLFVANNLSCEEESLSPQIKRALVNLVNCDMLIDSKFQRAGYAAEMLVQSLSSVITGRRSDILLPELIELKQHEYE